MQDIYQEIWDADQSENGVPPLVDGDPGDEGVGFATVNRDLDRADPDLRVIARAHIPEDKAETYALCRALFDNYALAERDVEIELPEERQEVHDLIGAMIDTAPMQVARAYIESATGTTVTKQRFYATLLEQWFRTFSQGGDPHLTGFEHVVVGEQDGSKAQGYHFWYKYYLDDGFARQVDGTRQRFAGLRDDRIVYLANRGDTGQDAYPECVTISYRWHAPDYDREKLRPLTKRIGGFFVGCSVEGLLALGTVRAHLGARAPKEAVINGARYAMKLYRSKNNAHVRTFYPVFLGPADTGPSHERPLRRDPPPPDPIAPVPTTIGGSVRIVAALLNPEGADPGREAVTLVNTGRSAVNLRHWRLIDKNGNGHTLDDLSLTPGMGTTLVLPKNTAQLSNKGGDLRLVDPRGAVVHRVSYTKAQAKRSGVTMVF